MPNPQSPPAADERSNKELMNQWRKLQDLKRSLVREGIVNGDAAPQQIFTAIRNQIPPGLF